MPPKDAETRPFTTRLPEREYQALKAYAFFTGRPLGEIVVRAVREFLLNHGAEPEVDDGVEAQRRRLRQVLEELEVE